ncbi:MAG TPA: VWA domain-containing protein [Pyrinomonadaceae bacterium]|nr:VWA domain-containing protein [Pyrinomonadaceae bacterium]
MATCLVAAIVIFVERPVTAQSNRPQKTGSPRPTSTPPADDEIVRVETNLVNTLFTAVDRDHHFITSMRSEDIAVFENDVRQTVSLFERETERPLSLVILVDTSESQRGVLQDEKSAARVFVDSVVRPDRDQAAIVSFTGVPKVEQGITNDLDQLRTGIRRVRIELSPENERRLANGDDPLPKDQDPSGYTGIWDAISMAIESVLSQTPENSRRAIVLLSDGDDTSSNVDRQDVINLAVRSNVALYAIGLRDQNFSEGKLDAAALRKVSDRTGGRAFFPQQPDELKATFAQIEQELRSQYLLAYSPTNKERDGSYRRIRLEIVNLELRKNKAQVLYRQGYYAKKS